MKKTVSVGLSSLALLAVFTFALTANVYAATLPHRSSPYAPAAICQSQLFPQNSSVIGLLAYANDEYVTADLGGGSQAPLRADSPNYYSDSRGTWERFDYIVNPGGSFSLRAHANGNYVTADLNGGSLAPLRADFTTIGTWQRFDWSCNVDGSFSITAHANGNYVAADLNGGSLAPLNARTTPAMGVGPWEEFNWFYA